MIHQLQLLLNFLLILLFLKSLYNSVIPIFSFEFEEEYLKFINDSIERENFKYYSFQNEGRYKLKLVSDYGDADIYVSSNKQPGFHPYEHDISSTSCGVDVVELIEQIKRPVYVGIYGSGHTDWSNYTLYISVNSTVDKYVWDLKIKHKLNSIIRYTDMCMWRVLKIIEIIAEIIGRS